MIFKKIRGLELTMCSLCSEYTYFQDLVLHHNAAQDLLEKVFSDLPLKNSSS